MARYYLIICLFFGSCSNKHDKKDKATKPPNEVEWVWYDIICSAGLTVTGGCSYTACSRSVESYCYRCPRPDTLIGEQTKPYGNDDCDKISKEPDWDQFDRSHILTLDQKIVSINIADALRLLYPVTKSALSSAEIEGAANLQDLSDPECSEKGADITFHIKFNGMVFSTKCTGAVTLDLTDYDEGSLALYNAEGKSLDRGAGWKNKIDPVQ